MPLHPGGYTLIEALISLLLIGAMFLAFQATHLGTPLIVGAKHQDVALKVAENKLEELRALGYDALPESGTFSDPLLSSLTSATGAVTVSTYTSETKRVEVAVSWLERGSSEAISLATLITETGGL